MTNQSSGLKLIYFLIKIISRDAENHHLPVSNTASFNFNVLLILWIVIKTKFCRFITHLTVFDATILNVDAR
jgi:hypothetical protein